MSLRKIERFFIGAAVFSIPFGTGMFYNFVVSYDLLMVQDLFILMAYLFWMNRTGLFTKGRLFLGSIGVWLSMLIIWSIFSLTNAISLQATGIGVYFTIKSFSLYFYILNNTKSKSDVLYYVNMMIFSLLFQGLIGTLQGGLNRTLGLSFLGEKQISMHGIDSRVRGTMTFPNRYGSLLVLWLPFAITLGIFARRSMYKNVLYAAAGLGIIGLFLSLSRSSWAGFFLAMVTMVILLMRRGLLKLKFIAVLFAVFIGVVVLALANKDIIEARLETGADGTHRTRMIDIAFPIIADYPIFGVGLNNYQWHSYKHFSFWQPVHNDFLRFAAETGIPGAIFFAGLLFAFLRESYRGLLIKDKILNAVAISAFCGILAFVVTINIGPQYQHYRIKLAFWAIAGVVFSLRRVYANELRLKKKKMQMELEKQDSKGNRPSGSDRGNSLSAHAMRKI